MKHHRKTAGFVLCLVEVIETSACFVRCYDWVHSLRRVQGISEYPRIYQMPGLLGCRNKIDFHFVAGGNPDICRHECQGYGFGGYGGPNDDCLVLPLETLSIAPKNGSGFAAGSPGPLDDPRLDDSWIYHRHSGRGSCWHFLMALAHSVEQIEVPPAEERSLH